MNKPIFEYIVSAPTFGIFPNILLNRIPKEQIREAINEYANVMHDIINKSCTHYEPRISMMFNAFTEKNKIRFFDYYGHCGFKSIYSDSGGLQLITRNHEITEELKDEIYETQTYSEYALCFDVISLSKTTLGHHRNERSQDTNKIFHQDDHKDAGFATGKNIKRQIETFKKLGAKTKVIIIVQGNTKADMLMFFNEIEKQLTDDDYNHVGGFAVADTCIGHGQIELIEMMSVAREISHNTHPSIANHVHLLGVGSIPRLAPAILLKKSNYLDTIDRISYDSSKISQSFMVGAAILNGKIIRLGQRVNQISTNHFKNVYNMFEVFFSRIGVSQDDYLNILFGDNSEEWSNANITYWARANPTEWNIALSYAYKTAHSFYQIVNFHQCIEGIFDGTFKLNKLRKEHTYLESLGNVRDDKDMVEWLAHQKQTRKTKSKRIRREEDVRTLEGLFV